MNKNNLIVLVTGASSGIGQAIAEIFAENGNHLILTGRREERLQELATRLRNLYSIEVHVACFDIRDREATQLALDQVPSFFNKIDILINNAGLAKGRAPIHEGQWQHWDTMIDTNLKGLLHISKLVSKKMIPYQEGMILNIGSVAGKEAYADGNVYCATKAAVDMLTKGMRLDLFKYGIKVAAVHPGHVETEFALVRFDGDAEKANIYTQFTPLSSRDVAETVYFVCTRPKHVVIQDVLMFSTQQANATNIDYSGKK